MRKFYIYGIGILLSLPILFLFAAKAHAVPVSPDKYYLEQTSGVISEKLTIYGKEQLNQSRTYYLTPVGMRKIGEENDREFFLVDEDDKGSLANYITLSQTEINLDPSETIIVPWTLNPPNELLGCGTSLAAIMISTEKPSREGGDSQILFTQQVISQIHYDVVRTDSGTCEGQGMGQGLELVDFYVEGFPIFNHGNVPFGTRIKNNGDFIARSPKGFIDITGFGGKVTIPFNEEGLDIYPDTVRKFPNRWYDEKYPHNGNIIEQFIYEITHPRIGKYEARLGVTKNVTPQITETISFWVIPWKLIIILLIIIAIAAYTIKKKMGDKKQS